MWLGILLVRWRNELAARLKQFGLHAEVPSQVWQKDWIVDCVPVGNGQRSLKYLAPYVHRIALSDRRICQVANDQVTFRYKPSRTDHWKLRTLPVLIFIALFLKHVLPRGFMKVRSYGLLASASRLTLNAIRLLVLTSRSQPPQPLPIPPVRSFHCPHCGGLMQKICFFPRPRPPPS